MKKITRGYVKHYDIISMKQTLPSGRHIYVKYEKVNDGYWQPRYSTDSAYHICPMNGRFINCKDCDAYDTDDCMKYRELVSNDEMASRATACSNAKDCVIDFRSTDGQTKRYI